MKPHIVIIADQINGEITPVTDELIACAMLVQQLIHADTKIFPDIKIFMTGCKHTDAPRRLAEKSGIDIVVINPGEQNPPHEILLKTLPAALIKDLNPVIVCMAHNSRGTDVAPGLAVKINAACITGVEKITRQADGICYTRSIFSDRITTGFIPSSKTTVLTILPGVFKPETCAQATAGKISMVDLPVSQSDYHFIGEKNNAADTSALDNADVIVSAGNGVRKIENLDLIFRLAKLFPKSAVTGSRPICDKKWLQYSRQVGITGATVKPKLYIACGISGSSQHISGMRDSKFIVSINTDPHAAIFNISDVCIIEDLTAFIPEILSAHASAPAKD